MNELLKFSEGEATRGQEQKVFDWVKATTIIKERGVEVASAGLQEDWEYTGDVIFANEKPVTDGYTYLASTWATPVLRIAGEEDIDCYVMGSTTEWRADTTWPPEALAILEK
jgi:hypothetical protein